MSRRKDLTGKTFGHLTVIRDDGKRANDGTIMWLCQCDCGKRVHVESKNLLNGRTHSCGHIAINDLAGRQFGHLTVLKDDGTRYQDPNDSNQIRVKWLCQCDCGKQIHVIGSALIRGLTISCGHVLSANAKKHVVELTSKRKAAPIGSKLAMIGDRKRDDNKSGYRNISIKKTRTGATRYLIYVGYHGEKHTATRTNLADALVAREKIRSKYWPDYAEYREQKPLNGEGSK
ncbi:hypothetical protein FD12_GL001370 [Lentilactobacillus rapi DSM 19907 = JCM 15042]|uniref:AP2 domain-containing protein n=3 Tax=Lactobacillaceae TaxID=33958 RepID=A0A512PLI4_9LACO|nr:MULTISPECIES: hypothetical protein [Lactobacillaceae]KRL17842.1 hypothetical protein FD12_GL001370 [Lentilactobacillus rapi DSM 19907 = JCM 15042]GEP72055.1 hypothetical protein LRA02_09230 [Lentilactobacillus rapi]